MRDISEQTKLVLCLFVIGVFVFLVRFPFFSFAEINWDESAYILMGRSVLNGESIYIDAVDYNFPFLYWFFALFVKGADLSISAVRFYGSVFVAVSAYLTFFASRTVFKGFSIPLFSGLFLAVLASDWDWDGMAFMKEHLALPFLCFGIFVLFRSQRGAVLCLLAGFALSVATLIFPASALFSLAVFVLLASSELRKNGVSSLTPPPENCLVYCGRACSSGDDVDSGFQRRISQLSFQIAGFVENHEQNRRLS